ncbi:ultraviolet-B receptor UVR8 [Ricinus communis]|uniref:ultraviolet-B receptor UVR8 n=1 Tax=Ricinus communis TaxID=3988 RepID=UPI00077226E7|nr:ultraviolet-B receptor UVR8 [Ricinus communis]XP_048235266.1 ultraviolet-B receptor UVR8 [Ricinus communis]|eukprot:XP_015575281.1 ultraviolet-B receptor UVR8 isoform X2 [Ricinus communis]
MQEENKKVKVKETEEREHEQQVWSWGAGTDGQLGTGKLEDEHLPQLLQFPSLSVRPISSLACGGAHVIALNSDGKVLTWGRGTSGQLGHGNMLSSVHPQPVTFLDSFVITHISAGWSHSGFVSDKGCVFTCGDGSFGQLGHGDNNSHATPVQVSYFANRHVHQIACGMRHSLVLLKDSSGNQVYGFGSGKRGQLGISKDKIKSISLPLVTCGFEDIKINSIITNGDHSAALSVDGHLYTWGRGFPGTSDVFTPRHLVSSLQFIKVALGWNHALALTVESEVFILGGDRHGALGDLEKISPAKHLTDPTHAIFDRVSILDGMKVVDIAAGSEHSALLTVDGTIKTWGWGEHGQLGLGSTKDQTNPQSVSLDHEAENQEINLKVYCGSGFTFVVRSLSTSQT